MLSYAKLGIAMKAMLSYAKLCNANLCKDMLSYAMLRYAKLCMLSYAMQR